MKKNANTTEVELISLFRLYKFLEEEKYVGSLWMHIDCPHAGNWVIETYKDHWNYGKTLVNIMLDASCD